MIAQINLETGEVVSASRLFELNPPEYIECPDDWHPSKYNYVNGEFIEIPLPEIPENVQMLMDQFGITQEKAQAIITLL